MGGSCLSTGTIPSKTFREAVLHFAALRDNPERRRFAKFEYRPTADQLLARVERVMQDENAVIEDQLRRNDVAVLRGKANFVDPHRIAVEGPDGCREVTAGSILVAVGTVPADPPGGPADGELVLTSDDVASLKRLPRSAVVVGAGVIGIEYASMFAAVGVEVTVVDRRERPLEFLDHEIVDGEDRWRALGRTNGLRVLVIAFTVRDHKFRPITGWKATKSLIEEHFCQE